MKILIRAALSTVLANILLGCNQEVMIRSIVLLVLLSTLIKCTQAYLSTPYPAKALPLATDQASSTQAYEVYQPKQAPADFVGVRANPYPPRLPSITYSYIYGPLFLTVVG